MGRPPKNRVVLDLVPEVNGNVIPSNETRFQGYGLAFSEGQHHVESLSYTQSGNVIVTRVYSTNDFSDAFDRLKIVIAQTFHSGTYR